MDGKFFLVCLPLFACVSCPFLFGNNINVWWSLYYQVASFEHINTWNGHFKTSTNCTVSFGMICMHFVQIYCRFFRYLINPFPIVFLIFVKDHNSVRTTIWTSPHVPVVNIHQQTSNHWVFFFSMKITIAVSNNILHWT